MLVKAKEMGYIYHVRVRPGQRFKLKDPKHFSEKWMEKVEPKKVEEEETVPLTKRGKTKKTPAEAFGSLVGSNFNEDNEEDVI